MSERLSLEKFLSQVAFNADGLVPVIAQDRHSGAVLMHAWMNRDALETTMKTGNVTYWSRARRELWHKGATSGHTQRLIETWIDCDGDTLLIEVEQSGPACHTGAPTCFFRRVALTEASSSGKD
ncbi:MAG TPA: phosphoribosyl-AMP cyclohydrolase [Rhizomicrobium sp.]